MENRYIGSKILKGLSNRKTIFTFRVELIYEVETVLQTLIVNNFLREHKKKNRFAWKYANKNLSISYSSLICSLIFTLALQLRAN